MKNSYKGMTGGLFDGEPLQMDGRAGRERMAQKIGETLRVIHGQAVSDDMALEMWKSLWRLLGYRGGVRSKWKDRIRSDVTVAAGSAQALRDEDGHRLSGKDANSFYRSRLTAIGRKMVDESPGAR